MSSQSVRTQIKQFLTDNAPTEKVVDFSAQFSDFGKLLSQSSIQPGAPWLGLEFIGDEELPVSLAATNDKGLYREIGSVILHVAAEAKLGAINGILTRGETLRNLFRGRRIGNIVVEGVTPVNTGPGSTLEFDGGYVSGTITIAYHADLSP